MQYSNTGTIGNGNKCDYYGSKLNFNNGMINLKENKLNYLIRTLFNFTETLRSKYKVKFSRFKEVTPIE